MYVGCQGVPWCGSGGEDSVVGGVLGCVCVCRTPRAVVVISHVQLV